MKDSRCTTARSELVLIRGLVNSNHSGRVRSWGAVESAGAGGRSSCNEPSEIEARRAAAPGAMIARLLLVRPRPTLDRKDRVGDPLGALGRRDRLVGGGQRHLGRQLDAVGDVA